MAKIRLDLDGSVSTVNAFIVPRTAALTILHCFVLYSDTQKILIANDNGRYWSTVLVLAHCTAGEEMEPTLQLE